MRVYLGIGAVIVAAVLIGGTYLPVTKHEGLRVCLHCGLNRKDKVVLGFRKSTITATRFSHWYDRRIGRPHEHQWNQDQSGAYRGENLWGVQWTPSQYESCRPGITYDYLNLEYWLLCLEAMNLDVDFWKELTHADSARAAQVISIAWEMRNGPDAEVRTQWAHAKLYLQNRGAWKEGFAKYMESPIESPGTTAPASSNP